jgi:hypothetical protein
MLKRISHIVLSVLLLASTMGLTISKHYCGDSLISISVLIEAESCCETGDCCHDETNFYQVDDDFSQASVSESLVSAEIDLLAFVLLLEQPQKESLATIQSFFVPESPPPLKIQRSLSKRQSYLL